MFQKQNETKRNFVTRRGSGKNWSAGSLIERTVARDARWPVVRTARFPTGFFLESMRIFFFGRRAMPCDTRPWLIVMQMIFAQRRKRLATTWTCTIYVHVHGKKIPERPRVSPTLSPRIWVLACSSSLSFSYRRSYPNSSSSLLSRHCLNILVSILVISTRQTPSSFPIALRETAI